MEKKITDNFKDFTKHDSHFNEVDGQTLKTFLADYHHLNKKDKKKYPWGAKIYRRARGKFKKQRVSFNHIAKSSGSSVNPKLFAAANQLRKRGGKKVFAAAVSSLRVTNSKEVQGIIKAVSHLTFDIHHKQHLPLGLAFLKFLTTFNAKERYSEEFQEAKNIVTDILILATPIIMDA